MSQNQITRIHLNLESKTAAIEFKQNGVSSRHTIDVDQATLDLVAKYAQGKLDADVGEVKDAAPTALTSTLHQLRSARAEVKSLDDSKRLATHRLGQINREIAAKEKQREQARK